MLEETGYVTPGKHLSEVRVLFMGRECFEALSHHDCQEVYDKHQKEIIEKAKHNFQVGIFFNLKRFLIFSLHNFNSKVVFEFSTQLFKFV